LFHPLLEELDGVVAELAGRASLEDSGTVTELAGAASELLDSIREESASCTELLTGSLLRGMSTAWLELEGVRVSLEVTDASLVGTFASALLAGPCVSAEPGTLSTELGVLLSGVTASPVADVLSSQALNANEAVIPSVTAMALLTFLFSIFTNTSTLCTKIHFFEGKRL
jgi:hypothetical protein